MEREQTHDQFLLGSGGREQEHEPAIVAVIGF